MEFNKRKLKFKFEGEEYCIPFPPVKLIAKFKDKLAEGNEINERDLPEFMFRNRLLLPQPGSGDQENREDDQLSLADVERKHITRVLNATGFNYSEASKKLGISRSTLWRKIKEYSIETA